MTSRDIHNHHILSEIERCPEASQRRLSREIGIALGLTNLLLRNLVRKGWVRVIHVKQNRVRYLLTPTGVAEKARMSRDAIRHSVRFYAEARARIRERLMALSNERARGRAAGDSPQRVVFVGAGEVAEIGYVCLQGTNLTLVGVVDDQKSGESFFGVPIQPSIELTKQHLGGVPYDRVVVMSFADTQHMKGRFADSGIPCDRAFWL